MKRDFRCNRERRFKWLKTWLMQWTRCLSLRQWRLHLPTPWLEVWTVIPVFASQLHRYSEHALCCSFPERQANDWPHQEDSYQQEYANGLVRAHLELETHWVALKFAKLKTRRDRLRRHRALLNSFFKSTAFQTRSGTFYTNVDLNLRYRKIAQVILWNSSCMFWTLQVVLWEAKLIKEIYSTI